MHFVGHVETFAQDWETIALRTGITDTPSAVRGSGAGTTLDALPLSRATAELLAERYQQDIDYFGYRDTVNEWLARLTRGGADRCAGDGTPVPPL